MKNYSREILHLVFPERCAVCGEMLPEGVRFMCPGCSWDMPLTGYWAEHDNPVLRKFGGLLPLREASSLIFYTPNSKYRTLVHRFKYYGQWRDSLILGEMTGKKLKESGLYDSVDTVVPVPLHLVRRLKRGYNQAEYLAQGIARELDIPLDTASVTRSGYNRSQTKTKDHADRWENVAGIFSVRRPARLDGRHILLVDDVLTTGATLISCAEEILRRCPSCRISIATLSVSAYELFGKRGGGL